MIAAGALEGVSAIYAQHIWSEVDAGLVSCEAGRHGQHRLVPHRHQGRQRTRLHAAQGHRRIVVACEIVDSLQLIVSRRISPFEPVVITIGEITAAPRATSWPVRRISRARCALGTPMSASA